MDEKEVKQMVEHIEEFVGKDLGVKINTDKDLRDFLQGPENFLQDENIVEKVKNLRDVMISLLGDAENGY